MTKPKTPTNSTSSPTKIVNFLIISTCIILFGLAIHTPIMVFLSSQFPAATIFFQAWKEILLGANTILAIYLITRQKLWHTFLHHAVFRASVIFCVFGLVVALLTFQNFHSFAAGLMIGFRFILIFLLIFTILHLYPSAKNLFLKTIIAGATLILTFGTLQALILPHDVLSHIGYSESTILPYQTVDQNYDFIRINSTLRGPNPLGAFALITLTFATTYLLYSWVQRHKNTRSARNSSCRITQDGEYLATKPVTTGLRSGDGMDGVLKLRVFSTFLILTSLICIYYSFSRAALLASVISTATAAFITLFHLRPQLIKILLPTILLPIALIATTIFIHRDHAFVQNVFFRTNYYSTSPETSDEQRIDSLQHGITQIFQNPLGVGVGTTGSASLYTDHPIILENQFLFVSHEIGIFGLVIFLYILTLIFIPLVRRHDPLSVATSSALVGLLVIGLFLPVFADETVSMIFFTLAAIALTTKGVKYAHKKAKRTS